MCTTKGNTNKGCYIPPGTCFGIVSVPSHPGYLVKLVAPT